MFLSQKDGDINIGIVISKGQFLYSNDCSVTVRIDELEPEEWRVLGTSDGSSDTIFFVGTEKERIKMSEHNYTMKAIDKIRAAKRIRVKATYFHEGERVFEFKPSGLKWPLDPNYKTGQTYSKISKKDETSNKPVEQAKPKLGINFVPAPPNIIASEPNGVLVITVEPNSIAAKYGISPGDIIYKYGSKSINSLLDMQTAVAESHMEENIYLSVISKGSFSVLTIKY